MTEQKDVLAQDAPCRHEAIIGLDGKWHCQKCAAAVEVAEAQSGPLTPAASDAEYVRLANNQLAKVMDENQRILAQVESARGKVSFSREWVERTIACLEGPLPSGKIGDAVFLLRDILRDSLSNPSTERKADG